MTKTSAKLDEAGHESALDQIHNEPASEPAEPATEHKDGLAAAEAHLAQFDEDATLLWDVNGPKRSRVARIGQFLVAPNGSPPVKLLCLAMVSGAFQLFAPANIALPDKAADAE